MKFQVGDKVEITVVLSADEYNGIKVGDVAKITQVLGAKWFNCANPEWGMGGRMFMRDYQLKKL